MAEDDLVEKKQTVIMSRPMAHKPHETAVVDIIVPFHGHYDRLSNLINSLYNTTGNPFRIILVDDGSPNPEFISKDVHDIIRKKNIGNIITIQHRKQLGFGAAVKSGFEASRKPHESNPENIEFPYVCVIQSDCLIVQPNWLQILHAAYLKYRQYGVKMISARLSKSSCGDPRIVGRGDDVILNPGNLQDIVEQEMYLPLTTVLFHKKLFDQLGPFVSNTYGMYEDIEYACRMASKGYKQMICGNSFVQHEDSVTFRSLQEDPKVRRTIDANFKECIEKIKKFQLPS